MTQKVNLSIFESSKCVYGENFWGNLRKTLQVFSRFKPRVIYMLTLHTTKLLLHITAGREFKELSVDLE